MKLQNKATARDLSKSDISNICGGEFKATSIRMVMELEKRIENIWTTLTTEIKDFKKYQ